MIPGGFRIHGGPPGDGDAGLVPRVPAPCYLPEKSALGEGRGAGGGEPPHALAEGVPLPLNLNL